MEDAQHLATIKDVLYLTSCALDGRVPETARVAEMDLGALFRVASKHMLTALVATALESAGVRDDAFVQAKGKAIRKAVLFNLERAAILEKLEAAGIWYMPLKGAILQDYYPDLGLRQMSDNDILVDPSRMDDIKAIMAGLGYAQMTESLVDASFHKEPVLNFEMHTTLFNEYVWETLSAYYRDVKPRLLKDADNGFGYHFSDEDFYLYQTTHEFKHYRGSGTGLRSLVDQYVFLRRKADSLDWDSVNAELAKLGIAEFESCLRRLATHALTGKPLAEDEARMLEAVTAGGVYGSVENRVSNLVGRYGTGFRGKVRYAWSRLFLPMYEVRAWYPTFAKHPILLPLLPFYRLGRSLRHRRSKLAAEVKALWKVN